MKVLIDFIIKEPTSDDHDYGHKFPFNASEILVSENGFFIDKFFEGRRFDFDDGEIIEKTNENNGGKGSSNENIEIKKTKKESEEESKVNYELFNYLFSILQTDEDLNYVLAGYFSKVFIHLINHRQDMV